MEVTTIQKFIHTSPRKLRLVADMIRKTQPLKALDVLRLTPKMAAKDLSKAIETVLANAKNLGIEPQATLFKIIEINESAKMRRLRAGTRGRTRPFKRRMAHIKIVLTDDLSDKAPATQAKRGEQVTSNKKREENNETEAQTGQSSNGPKVKKGGRTGLSK